MVKIYLILVYFLLCCTQSKETNKDLYKEEILGESFYANGRSKIKVIKGRTPGEDTYLKILHFDSIGKLSLEYGAQHYGSKYKSAYKYDLQGKLKFDVGTSTENKPTSVTTLPQKAEKY